MARHAVTSNATGRVLRWGDLDFGAAGEVGAGETQVLLNPGAFPADPAQPLHHFKIVAQNFAVMTAPEQAAADAEVAAVEQAQAKGGAIISRTVAALAQLPLPPPAAGLLVGVQNGGGGVPALAISSATRWFIFDSDRAHGP